MKRDYLKVLQLTDLHLFAEPTGLFNRINTRDSFIRVVAHIQRHYGNPDAVVITGDLAHDGEPATYRFIAAALKTLEAPVYFVLGNHDHPANAQHSYPMDPVTTDRHCVLGNWQMILLDSNHRPVSGSYEGEVSAAELRRIGELTEQYPDKWTLIAMHHNLPDHDDRGVALEVRNHRQVMQHLERQPNIKLVLSGHVHQEFAVVQNGICYLSTPSTGYQSKSKSGQITGEAAGYRWLKLYRNGRFETDVRRITVWAS